ncbi:response regulator [uncultured Selenomonas sp.]|uniref:response regulator transcription factor n=1 Tax=uncultured Selenomonas sp. TaxID=159275 RepID=UPI0028D0307C|nr:response regulator [uncultured Selenomonas sp.]
MLRLIIVEDEEMIRRGLVSTIDWTAMGCIVAGDAPDGGAGLALLRMERPDVVVTDIRMPRMDGIAMAEQARAEGILPHLVFLTSYADFGYAKKAIALRAADYLLKPVDEVELAALMRRIAVDRAAAEEMSAERINWTALPAEGGGNPYVRHAMERIRTGYREKLSIELLAEEAGVSASYLSRKFKESAGQTFLEALTRHRLQCAMSQLASGRYRIYEVAEENGFSDYKQFCSAFKKYTQRSPRAFMQEAQGHSLRADEAAQ